MSSPDDPQVNPPSGGAPAKRHRESSASDNSGGGVANTPEASDEAIDRKVREALKFEWWKGIDEIPPGSLFGYLGYVIGKIMGRRADRGDDKRPEQKRDV
ncbi:MAG: hypothetical protein ACRDKG_04005 [Actinomycetota bacterium]